MLQPKSIHRWPSIALAVGLGITFFSAQGQVERAPLPQPLTLQSALTVSLESHPDLVPARARLQAAQIRETQVDASYGFDAFVELQPRASSRASNSDTDFQNDSRYGLVLDKRLTDFGRTTARKEAVHAEINARQAELIARQDQRLLDVMNRYFSVILADYAYRARNEQLALDYFRFSRMQERHERFEQFSELEVAEKEAIYRKAYVDRHRADLERRLTRHELALTLGRPGELSSELQMPDLSVYLEREIPIYTEIVDQAIARSPIVQARRDDVAAARAKVDVAKKINSPVLSIQLEARDYYDTSFSSRDRYRANLKLIAPIFNGTARQKTAVALAQLELFEKEAELVGAEFELREILLNLLAELQVGQAEISAAEAVENYRAYYQDRSRAMYEMEMRADFGDAQTAVAEAIFDMIRVEFQQAMRWARFDVLLARPSLLIKE